MCELTHMQGHLLGTECTYYVTVFPVATHTQHLLQKLGTYDD